MLATGTDGLRARHEEIRLAEEARGRGFARALHEHAEPCTSGWRSPT